MRNGVKRSDRGKEGNHHNRSRVERTMSSSDSFLFLLLLVALYCVTAHSMPLGGNTIARQLPSEMDFNQVRAIVPLEAAEFYDRLTPRDKEVLQNVLAKGDSYTSAAEVLNDLRNGSSTLYEKAVQVVTSLRQAVAKLSPPARAFIDESVVQVRGALTGQISLTNVKTEVKTLVQRYRQLGQDTRQELRNAFPMVATVVDNSIFQTLASGLLGIEPETGTGTATGEQPDGERDGGGGRDRVTTDDDGGEGNNGVEERVEKKIISPH